jgi:acetyl-CoA carboxylase biotin carboxylase subunit
MTRKVLIACGGEAATRLISAFARSNVRTVTVYTQADSNSKHVQLADQSICIGKTLKSYYSDWHRIISAAELSEVDAIHAGDGPLATHERFAEVCTEIGVQLIGRKSEEDGST